MAISQSEEVSGTQDETDSTPWMDVIEDEAAEDEPDTSGTQNNTTADISLSGGMPEGVDLVVRGGGYVYEREDHFEDVTNFILKTKARVRHTEDGTKVFKIEVVPPNEDSYEVEVEPKVFNNTHTFQNQIVTGFSTRFDGGKTALNDLREIVASQEADTLEGTNLMGRHDDEFVTPDGTLTEDGWTDQPDTVFVKRETDIERRWSLSSNDDPDDNDVEDILRLLPRIRHADRFLTVLGWFYAAPLKPLLLEWGSEFPLLSVTGDTGSGKTSTLQVLWRAFGMDEDPLSVDTTPHAQLTNFASSHSVPVWFDEYRPANIKEQRVDKFHDYCRKATKGATESKGNPDGSTTTYRIHAPVVVSGEQQFRDAALRRRSVLTNFRTEATDEGTETYRDYARLTGESFEADDGSLSHPEPKDLRAHAYAYYRWLLGQDADELRDEWCDCRCEVEEVLARHEVSGLDSSERTALRVPLLGLRLYQRFADDLNVSVPIDAEKVDKDVENSLIHAAKNVGDSDGGRKSHLERFLEMLGRAAAEDYLKKDEHYTFVNGSTLRFNLRQSYDKVRKYDRDHNLDETLFKKEEYRSRLHDNEGEEYVEKVGIPTDEVNRAVGIRIEEAESAMDISQSMFKESDEGSVNEESI